MSGNVGHIQEVHRQTGRGNPLLPDEPRTLAELFRKAAQKHERSDALNFKKDGEWRAIGSAEMIERAENIALGLYSLGLRKGDKAAILAANSPEWTLADAGCQFAGVVDVPVYTTLSGSSICYILNDSGTKVFFIENKAAYDRIADVFPDCVSLERLVFFDPEGVSLANAISLSELEGAGERVRAESPGLVDELTAATEMSIRLHSSASAISRI